MRAVVLDDDPKLRTLVRVVLENAGFDVFEAPSGADAIKFVRESGADLVVSDIFMPDVDGLEVIRTLHRECPTLKIIAMSGGGFGGTVDMLTVARRFGAAQVLEKPFTARRLLAVAREVLGALPGEG